MTASSIVGPDPHGKLLSQNKGLSGLVVEGASGASEGKSPTEVITDHIASKVFSAADSIVREAVIGPVEVVVGPVLKTLDDLLPEEVTIPVENLEQGVETTPLGEAIARGLCEETYDGVDAGIAWITKANAQLGEKTLQALRDAVRFCAHPATSLDSGSSTEASVQMITGVIESLSPDTRKALNLDALAADLRNKVNGDPKNFLSVLLQGLANMIPEAQPDRRGADRSSVLEMAPAADIPLGTGLVQNGGQGRLFSDLPNDTPVILPFQIPKDGPGIRGGTDKSSSLDLLLGGSVEIPELVVPQSKSNKDQASSRSFEENHQQDEVSSESSANSNKAKHFSDGPKPKNFNPFPNTKEYQAGQGTGGSSSFDGAYVPRPPDFKRFTGEFLVSAASDPLADEKHLANLCAHYKKKGWPQARIDKELKLCRNKIHHREEKLAGIDLDIRLISQQARVQQAKENLTKAEQKHAQTKKDAWRISEASVYYTAELESLKRLAEEAQKNTQKQTGKGFQQGSIPHKKGSVPEAPPAPTKTPPPSKNNEETPAAAAQTSQTPNGAQPITPSVQELEAMIREANAKIRAMGKEEQRATDRLKRYKKTTRKTAQKFLHKFFNARKPNTVIAEETIIAQDCHQQLEKLQSVKASLHAQLEEAKRLISGTPPADLSSKKIEDITNTPGSAQTKNENVDPPEAAASEEKDPPPSKEIKEDKREPCSEREPEQKEEKSLDPSAEPAPKATQPDKDSSAGWFRPLIKARDKVKEVQEKIAEDQKRLSRSFEETCLEHQDRVGEGKADLAQAKRFQKFADLIDQELAKGKDSFSLKTEDRQEITFNQEKAKQLKAAVERMAGAKALDGASTIVDGGVHAAAAHSMHSATGRLSKEVKTAGTTVANSLGSNVGSVAVDFGARCIQKGTVELQDATDAAKSVVNQTAKGVLTQVGQSVARSAIKGAVKEVAPELAKRIPGLATINNTYAVGKAILSANSVGEAAANGANAAADVGISYGCAAVGQALIPIPFVGACVGAAAGSLIIRGKDCFVHWCSSEPEPTPVTA